MHIKPAYTYKDGIHLFRRHIPTKTAFIDKDDIYSRKTVYTSSPDERWKRMVAY
jgi:hypothetical protein